jgi:hypothetical protein
MQVSGQAISEYKQKSWGNEKTILIEPLIVHHFIGSFHNGAVAHERDQRFLDLAAFSGITGSGIAAFE